MPVNLLILERLQQKGFDIRAEHHAQAILRDDMAEALSELEEALVEFSFPVKELVKGGGGEAQVTQQLRKTLAGKYGWKKHSFQIKKLVDGKVKESSTHEIDHVKCFERGTFALEIEWNNKDAFFDRDLENFRRLHAEGAISVGGIVTRGTTLQDGLRDLIEQFARKEKLDLEKLRANYKYRPTERQKDKIDEAVETAGSFEKGWAQVFVQDKFGEATTHWRKLEERIERGLGSPCPLLLIGIPKQVVEP